MLLFDDQNRCTTLPLPSLVNSRPASSNSISNSTFDPSLIRPLRELIGSTCYCNRLADQTEPNLCRMICSDRSLSWDCACKDWLRGGEFCSEEICKTGGRTFCAGIPMPTPCDRNVDKSRLDDFPYCPCSRAGNLSEIGICVCDQHHTGLFCENYIFPESTTSSVNSSTRTSVLVCFLVVIILICALYFLCCILCARTRRLPSTPSASARPPVVTVDIPLQSRPEVTCDARPNSSSIFDPRHSTEGDDSALIVTIA